MTRTGIVVGVLTTFPAVLPKRQRTLPVSPREPITINLNVKVDAEVRVKLEDQAEKDIENAPEIF